MTAPTTRTSTPSESRERRKTVEARLRALGPARGARRVSPPEGRLGADEQRVGQLRATLAALGPVFTGFGRYLSTRVDLLARRDCMELSSIDEGVEAAAHFDSVAIVARELGDPARCFFTFDPVPRAATLWTQVHDASLAPGVRVDVTIVRPDAGDAVSVDLPLLPLLASWFDVPAAAFQAAIDDYGQTLQRRLDQTWQATAFVKLADDQRAGGGFTAPVCYRDYCTPHMLTLEHVEGATVAAVLEASGERHDIRFLDRGATARQLASAWVWQAVSGHVVPFDFDLRDLRLHENRLVLTSAAFEPQTTAGHARFLSYLVAVAADDPDAAAGWIAAAATRGADGEPEDALLRRLRQVVPFRDGEWSGDDRFAEHLLAQWRATSEAGWQLPAHQLHLYRGMQMIAVATTRLAPAHDVLLASLKSERLRLGLADAVHVIDPRGLPAAMDKLLHDVVNLPQQLDQILTLAAEGKLRVKLHVPEAQESRQVKNRTVSLVASLVILTGLTFVLRHVAPSWGPGVERLGFLLLLVVGGWLLVAAARL